MSHLPSHQYRIYVRSDHLSLGTDSKFRGSVEEYFKAYGETEDIHFPRSQPAVCYVSFKEEKSMNAVLESAVHTIRNVGHHVSRASKRPTANPHEPVGRIHIHGITKEIASETILREFFEKFGEVRDVCVPTHGNNGKPKGFAFVSFTKQADCGKVLDSLPIKIRGVGVDVSQAKPRENRENFSGRENPRGNWDGTHSWDPGRSPMTGNPHSHNNRNRSNSFSSASFAPPQFPPHFGASGSGSSMPNAASAHSQPGVLGDGWESSTSSWMAQAAAMGYDQATCLAMMANAAALGYNVMGQTANSAPPHQPPTVSNAPALSHNPVAKALMEPPSIQPLGANTLSTSVMASSPMSSDGGASSLPNASSAKRNASQTHHVQVIGLDRRITKDMLLGHFWHYGQVNDIVIDGTTATVMFASSDALANCITSGASNIAGLDFSELQVAVSRSPPGKKLKM